MKRTTNNTSFGHPYGMAALFLSITVLLTFAACDIADDRMPFKHSEWISVGSASQTKNQWLCFRKEFEAEGNEETAYLRIAVDSKYWLWVNGKLAVFEGQLKRGPDKRNTYYDTVDIAPWLVEGKNTIAVLVWYFGKGGFNHNDSGIPALIVDGKAGKARLASNDSWKVRIHPAYGESAPPHPNGRLPESNVRFDARRDISDWIECDYDDSGWADASVMGKYPCEPWNSLVERPFPLWKDFGLAPYDSVYTCRVQDTLVVTGVLPANLSITPYICVESPEGKMIDIRTDNYRFKDKACVVRAEYITKEGRQEFEAFAYMNGHKVIYKVPSGVKVIDVKYRDTRFNTEYIGEFRCDDEFLNKLWQKSITTMNLNMRDCIQDPDRERAQWWGDAVIVLGEILYSCDGNGRDLIRKAVLNLADWQRPDSVIVSPVPYGSPRKELPGQMLASIGQYGFLYYYKYTGDLETIRHTYPAVKKYMGLWDIDERNLVIHRKGDWDWHDWGSDIDGRMLDNTWYALALEGMAGMAEALGYQEEADSCRVRKGLIKEAVNKHYWKGSHYRSDTYKGHTDDRANAMAAIAGFTDAGKWKSIKNLLETEFHAGPYIEKFVIESFFLNEDAEGGIKRMKTRYREMVESELTTLWEYWNPGGSINHGWAGGPMVIMSQYIAGIAPTSTAWETFEVKPQTGHLKEIHCTVPTVKGDIRVDVKNATSGYSVFVHNYTPSEFDIYIPADRLTTHITVNDRSYPASLLHKIRQEGVRYCGTDGKWLCFRADSSKVNITVI